MIKQPNKEKQQKQILNENEIQLIWKTLNDQNPLITTLFRIRLLTAQRNNEVHETT